MKPRATVSGMKFLLTKMLRNAPKRLFIQKMNKTGPLFWLFLPVVFYKGYAIKKGA
jgi:hypothetical protein